MNCNFLAENRHIAAILISQLALAINATSAADVYFLTSPSITDDWSTSSNWSSNAIPDSSTSVFIENYVSSAPNAVITPANVLISEETANVASMAIGYTRYPSVSSYGFGYVGPSYGIVSVTGAEAQLNVTGLTTIGAFGNGSLSILNAGEVNLSSMVLAGREFGLNSAYGKGYGHVTVGDMGSQLNTNSAVIGMEGAAELSIIGGGSMFTQQNLTVGSDFFSQGNINVNGSSSQLSIGGKLILGEYGEGNMLVLGGVVSSNQATLGYGYFNGLASGGVGTATLNGSSSQWINTGEMIIGEMAKGTLDIQNGAIVRTGSAQIGSLRYNGDPGYRGNGTVIVGGAGSQFIVANNLGIGMGEFVSGISDSGSKGTLDVTSGGVITVGAAGTGIISLGLGEGSSGTINVGDYVQGSTGGTINAGSIVSAESSDGVLGNAVVNFNQSDTFILASNIAMSGKINQRGQGTTILTGSVARAGNVPNPYGFGTHLSSIPTEILISAGTLQLGNGGTTGSVAGNIENNSHLIFNRSDNLSFGGIISGSGDVTKLGAGILNFTNHNNYTGATFVNAGTLTVQGSIMGSGGLVTVAAGATLNGIGTVNRDVLVNSNGNLAGSLVITGQVTLANQQSVGAVSSGTRTANNGQQLVVSTATGGTVDTSAGTASIETLNGATLQTGNWGASVVNLVSGTVQTSGGSLVAQQGDFTGTISGSGGLTKTGAGILTLNNANSYTGATIVRDGTLEVAVSGAIGSIAPVQLENDGILRVNSSVAITGNVVTTSADAKYVKQFVAGEALSNYGSFQSNLSGSETTASIAQGTATVGNQEVTMQFSNNGGFGSNASDRLSITGLNGTAFLLVMDVNMNIPVNPDLDYFFLGWFDPDDGALKNAVDGNDGVGVLAGGYKMSYESFLLNNGGWNSGTMLGAYGADADTDQVWAVINHNSEFAVAPEPSTCGLLLLGTATLVTRRRRK